MKFRIPFFGGPQRDPDMDVARALYAGVIERARDPSWYRQGKVPDTVDGRFDMVALMLSLLMLRLETIERDRARRLLVRMTELFVDDMDSSLRTIGIGDMMIGKHVGRTMSALGGRLGAYRRAYEENRGLRAALQRNLYRGEADPETLEWAAERVREQTARLSEISDEAFLTGEAA